MKKVISGSLSPNTELDDVLLAISVMFRPWMWQKGEAISKVENWFKEYFKSETVTTYNSGRSALLGILRAFTIGVDDEVLIQAFTCVAVPNSVIWAGSRPVYVDVDETYNMDPIDLARKITKKTKAIIVQHTFGIPAQIEQILSVAKKHKLIVIEDCAHSLGAVKNGKKLGTFGDAAFFSFGRDKVLSSVWGGAAIINSEFRIQNSELKKYQENLPMPNRLWILQQLLHPITFSLILPSYNIGIGKILLVILQKLRLLSYPVYPMERSGKQPKDFPAKYPNALAELILLQLKKLERYNKQRQHTSRMYHQQFRTNALIPEAIYLRYPTVAQNPESLIRKAKKKGILLGNWYHNVVDPKGVTYSSIGYIRGSCPKAEYLAKHVLNLPTRISHKEAEAVIRLFND